LILSENILLSNYTTINLGGKAKYFIECDNSESIISVLKFAGKNNLKLQIISGGSNIVFSDNGFDGIVVKINIKGLNYTDDKNYVNIVSGAGENWDDFVKYCIENNLSGVECLSGIPGSVGATPVQNVGAYGQEVKEIIESVTAVDRNTFEIVIFKNSECDFDYRNSRFKEKDKDRFIITSVNFKFIKNREPEIKYPELNKIINASTDLNESRNLKDKLYKIRLAVLNLRKKKSMVIDSDDLNSRSCGSFFTNPVLYKTEFNNFIKKAKIHNLNAPFFENENLFKIPAGWLIENSGFKKGYKYKGVGISENHSLALVNYNGTTKDLLALASGIENNVYEKFGLKLSKEPVIIP